MSAPTVDTSDKWLHGVQGGDADFVDRGDGTGDIAYVDPIDTVTGCEKIFVQS